MNTHYLQQLSFHKLEIHQPTASLHSFVLVRNSLLESIRTQQQQDSWLDACFDELAPDSSSSTLSHNTKFMDEQVYDTEQQQEEGMDDIDMLLLEEDDELDDLSDDDDDNDPVSPEQSTLSQQSHYQARPIGSPAFFIPMDDEEEDEDDHFIQNTNDFMTPNITSTTTNLLPLTTSATPVPFNNNNHTSTSTTTTTKQVLGTKKGNSIDNGGSSISDYWPS